MRKLWILPAVLLPIMAVVGIAQFSTPIGFQTAAVAAVPDTLDEAKQLAAERLAHLQKLTQAQWDIERQKIPHKHPPAHIEDAIARTQWRIDDLNQMTDENWATERKKLLQRAEGA